MADEKEVKDDFQTLRTLRDEIRVQLHLAAAEAKDGFEDLEKKWVHAEGKLKQLGEESADSAERVADALGGVLDEIRAGYDRVKKLL